MSNRNSARRKKVAGAEDTPTMVDNESAPTKNSLLNFSTPTEIVELPSRGIFYGPGHALEGRDTVEIKYMTAKEEDILTSPALIKKGIALERLMGSIVVENINTMDLLIADRNAILMAARVTGYGPDYNVHVSCPSCEQNFEHEFDLSRYAEGYDFDAPEESIFHFTKEKTFEIELPTSKVLVEIKALTGHEENKLTKIRELKSKNNLPETNLTDLFRMMIMKANGIEDQSQIAEFIDNMPAIDSRFLRAAYTKIMPSVNFSQAAECTSCGNIAETEVPVTAEFFWPKQ